MRLRDKSSNFSWRGKNEMQRSNDSGFQLQDHDADPEREPPGEGYRTPCTYPPGSKPWFEGFAGCANPGKSVPT
jgi:hypothetical protein